MNHFFKKYKNIHSGKRVFLIGNGPSLLDLDLNILKNEITISMNRISILYDKYPGWRPTYYLFSSTNILNKKWSSDWKKSVEKAVQEKKTTCFISSKYKEIIKTDSLNSNIEWINSISETKPSLNGDVAEESFSRNLIERVDKSGTSMNMALQIAFHMDFSEIILVGCDLNWKKDLGSKSDPNHFVPGYQAEITNPLKVNFQMRNIHNLALKNFMKYKPGIKIYNASNFTVLDTYPIIKLNDLLKKNRIIIDYEKNKIAINFWKRKKVALRIYNFKLFFLKTIKKNLQKIINFYYKLFPSKIDIKDSINECGFLYICTGESYIKECLFSIESLKRKNNKKIAVFSEEKYRNEFLSKVDFFYPIKKSIKRPKVDYLNLSPFSKTVYLDTDTFIDGNLDEMFALLEKFDFAASACHSRARQFYSDLIDDYKKIPYSFSELNSGVLAFKKNKTVSQLLENWRKLYFKYMEITQGWDQPSFRIALWNSEIKLYVLQVEYNLRPKSILEKIKKLPAKFLGKDHLKPRIYHAHYDNEVHQGKYEIKNLDELEKKIKEKSLEISY